MKNKLPWLISAIVFIAVMAIGLLSFHKSAECVDAPDDGYPTTSGSIRVVEESSCLNLRTISDAESFTTNALRSAIWALVLGIIAWGIVWIACWKNISIPKKLGVTLLMLTFAFVGFRAATAIVALLSEGMIYVDQTAGMIAALLCALLPLIGSLALIHIITKRKRNTKSSRPAHQRTSKK